MYFAIPAIYALYHFLHLENNKAKVLLTNFIDSSSIPRSRVRCPGRTQFTCVSNFQANESSSTHSPQRWNVDQPTGAALRSPCATSSLRGSSGSALQREFLERPLSSCLVFTLRYTGLRSRGKYSVCMYVNILVPIVARTAFVTCCRYIPGCRYISVHSCPRLSRQHLTVPPNRAGPRTHGPVTRGT